MGAIGGRLDGASVAAQRRKDQDAGDASGSSGAGGSDEAAGDGAEENHKVALVEMLLERGADPKLGNQEHDTPLHFACEQVAAGV
jgi:ankyrin repeat protein